jgi:hypothetical protein
MQASVVLRKAVQIIVMSVTVVTLPVFIELLRDAACTLSRDRHVIVTVTVTEETPYLSGLLATVTAMTLMTMIYGLILDRGEHLYFVGPYPFNLPDEPDVLSKELRTCAAFHLMIGGRVCRTYLTNRRRHPTTDHLCRRVGREHRRVSNLNPTTANPLLMPDTPAIVGFVGFCEKVWERIPGESGRRRIGRGALRVLKP